MKTYNMEHLKTVYHKTGKITPHSDFGKFLRMQTSWLDKKYNKVFPRQRLWHLIKNTSANPGCKICGNDIKWDDSKKTNRQRYRKYCSHKCQMNDPDIQKQKRETEIKRYGVGRVSIIEKIKHTNNKRYGADFAIQTEKYKKKKKITCLEKYGVDNPIKLKSIVQKREQTNLENFGLISFAQKHLDAATLNKLHDIEWLTEQHHVNKKSITIIANELKINYDIIIRAMKRLSVPIVHYPTSGLEIDVHNYISEIYNGVIETNNRTMIHPKHIDIVIPEKKLAYEINGIYWHSELNGRTQNYHLNKTKDCNNNGFTLIHINENDWYDKNTIIKSMLAYNLNSSLITTIYARKCKIVEITSKEARCFFNENHIQGYRPCANNIALIYNNEIVSCMSFGKPRYAKKYEYELYRFCSSVFISVPGGASKIFKYFINTYKPKSIITYSDKSRGGGNLYKNIGFEYSHCSTPNYWYFKIGSYILESRVKFQKHKLEKLLDNYDPNLSEWKNMVNNGYNRIWDCGNSVWVWTAQ